MLQVWEKSTGNLGGRKTLLATVRTQKEGEAFLKSHVGDRKVPWLVHSIEEVSAEEERAAITDIEREERMLAIEERKMELAERATRLELAKRMAASAGKPPVDAEEAVKEFLASGAQPKVGVVEGEAVKTEDEPK